MNNIQAGDVVMVVRPTICCNRPTGSEGKIFKVTLIESFEDGVCIGCSRETKSWDAVWPGVGLGAVDSRRLIKIPPLTPEGEQEHQSDQSEKELVYAK